jgi:hypothetical protein
MTFVVGQDGVIHEKDLGVKTAEASAAITAYDPSWTVVLVPDSASTSPGPRRQQIRKLKRFRQATSKVKVAATSLFTVPQ